MNTHSTFEGTGMRQDMTESEAALRADDALAAQHDSKFDADEAFADAVQGALSEPIPQATSGDRAIFERSIAARRAEKAKQQAIAAAAMAKARQLTASIRSMEDALDSLLTSEA